MKNRTITQDTMSDLMVCGNATGPLPMLSIWQGGRNVVLNVKGVRKLRKVLKEFDLEASRGR